MRAATASARLLGVAIALWGAILAAGTARAALVDGWTVFTTGQLGTPNRLLNPGFELGTGNAADNWNPYEQGYAIDTTVTHGGGRAVRLTNAATSDVRGAVQAVFLEQTVARRVFFSAWSRAENLVGSAGPDYSVYLDVYYQDGTALYAQTLTFAAGTHDWQYRESYIVPEKPIQSIYVYLLLRHDYVGTVWFDDILLQEFPADAAVFDGTAVKQGSNPAGLTSEPVLSIATADGLALGLTRTGGAVASLLLDGRELVPAARQFSGGLFFRDVFNRTDFLHFGGTVVKDGDTLTQTGQHIPYRLSYTATWRALADSIVVEGSVTSLLSDDRAIAVYFALPLDATGWQWGDDVRHSRTVSGRNEFRNTTSDGYDQEGLWNRYPWAAVTGLEASPGTASGLSYALPIDAPRRARLALNPATRQYFAVFDLGLSTAATHDPKRATFAFRIYRHAAAWPYAAAESTGFRAAAQRYVDLFPEAFTRRTPPGGEGIWIAFTELSTIPGLADFGVAYHEAGLYGVAYDDSVGIATFRYVTEPFSYHMPVHDPALDPTDYDDVMAYLTDQYEHGSGRDKEMAEATLSSGLFDDTGRYRFFSEVAPWCNDGGTCVTFLLDPDPEVDVPPYTINKAETDWNATVQAAYDTTPTLDGEYVDGMLCHPTVANFRRAHFAASDLPLTFDAWSRLLQVPELFSTYEYLRWLTDDVHARGKLTMANAMLLGLPWGIDLFDFGGAEVYWYRNGSFEPPADWWLTYQRTMSYRKPFGTLLNMDFNQLTPERAARYFRISLFYGIYPSFFSDYVNGLSYFERPDLYERDRPLFRKFIPLVRELSGAGWEPVTHARSSDPAVYVERWGSGASLRLTLRNDSTAARSATVTVDAAAVGLPAAGTLVVRDRVGGRSRRVDYSGDALSFSWDVAADAVAMLAFGDAPPPTPDGRSVPGTPLQVSRAGGEDVIVTWDAETCRAPGYHLVWYDLAQIASYTVRDVTCAAGDAGLWTGTPPPGDVGVLAVSDDGAGVEGSYGVDDRGEERPSTTSACGLGAKRIGPSCP